MASGVFVSARSALIERKVDHGAQRQRRRQWMFAGQSFGDRSQDLVLIAVQLSRSTLHEFRRAIQGGPRRQERQHVLQALEVLDVIERTSFRFDVVEIG